MGWFNAPIQGSTSGVRSLVDSNLYGWLMANDKMYIDSRQLSIENQIKLQITDQKYDINNKEFKMKLFGRFYEGSIQFAPTNQLIPFSDSYNYFWDWEDVNKLGWTDRIIWTNKDINESKEQVNFKQISYDSNNLIKWTENRPVFSQFSIHY